MAARIYRSLDEVPPDFGPSALTIGNFDGVHAGHRRIFRRVRDLAAAQGWKPSVLTFDPHPTRVVAPQRAPRLMTSCDERAVLMAEEGIEQVLILPFDARIAQLPPEQYLDEVLVRRLGVRAVAVGDTASATGRRAISSRANWASFQIHH
jgi:riboflavin kinase/FMN adenylyltransferase